MAADSKCTTQISDQVFFSLDAERFWQFAALLDAPFKPNAGLERLLAVSPPWSSLDRTDALSSSRG